ncbi:Oidioi.mRNA.OKI2018_I69.chr2.g6155.t1.cds [Oikopleura dioica]|uniref:Oidioi.mRNA.OKI2018_I69.chr2.g6155.t1.cds n=1 Tax=Oikopleura dioica TaxID=34765 RepID=A0ABN7T5S0_OIKDI|nr:Oidioi.mRNA.OKI2018_I69.chr2.g6155.t1.cds [Oikopleura dioica]
MATNPRKKTKQVSEIDTRSEDEKAANRALARKAARKFASNRDSPAGPATFSSVDTTERGQPNAYDPNECSSSDSDVTFVCEKPAMTAPSSSQTQVVRRKVVPTKQPAYPARNKKRKKISSDESDEPCTEPAADKRKPKKKDGLCKKNGEDVGRRSRSPKSKPIPRYRRLQNVPLGTLSQMDWMDRKDPNTPKGDSVAPPNEPIVKPILAQSESNLPREISMNNAIFELSGAPVDVVEGDAPDIPLNLARKSDTDRVQEQLASIRLASKAGRNRRHSEKSKNKFGIKKHQSVLSMVPEETEEERYPEDHEDTVTESEDSNDELRMKIKGLEQEKPMWYLNRFQLRRFFSAAFDSKNGIRPSLRCTRIANFLQRVDRKLSNAEHATAEQDDSPTYRVFFENTPKYTSFDPFYTEPGAYTGVYAEWDKLGAFKPYFAVDGFGHFYIRMLKIWVHYPSGVEGVEGAWKLVDFADRSLGHPAKVLAAVNKMSICAYPWPTKIRVRSVEGSRQLTIVDPNGPFKASILLINGFIPLVYDPPYKEQADLLFNNPEVLDVLCDSDMINERPNRAQVDAVNTRLENFVWRCIPNVFRADLFGATDDTNVSSSEHKTVDERFQALQKQFDSLFGPRDRPENNDPFNTKKRPIDIAVDQIFEALPPIFKRYDDFWPSKLLIEAILYANSSKCFTESTDMMAMMGVSRGIPAKIIAWQIWAQYQPEELNKKTVKKELKQVQKKLEKGLKKKNLGVPTPSVMNSVIHNKSATSEKVVESARPNKRSQSSADTVEPEIPDPLLVGGTRRGVNRDENRFGFFKTRPKSSTTAPNPPSLISSSNSDDSSE